MASPTSRLDSLISRLEASASHLPATTTLAAKKVVPTTGAELAAWEAVTQRLEKLAAGQGSGAASLACRLEGLVQRLEAATGGAIASGAKAFPQAGAELAAWAAVASRLEAASGGEQSAPDAELPSVTAKPVVGGKVGSIRDSFFAASLLNEVRKHEVEELYSKDCSSVRSEAVSSSLWSLQQTAELCAKGGEARFQGKAELLRTELFTSVSKAVEALNTTDGAVACPEGICVVLSEGKGKYFLLYRQDTMQKAFDLFSLKEG